MQGRICLEDLVPNISTLCSYLPSVQVGWALPQVGKNAKQGTKEEADRGPCEQNCEMHELRAMTGQINVRYGGCYLARFP